MPIVVSTPRHVGRHGIGCLTSLIGLLVYRSGFLPRILGAALMVNCFAFLISSFTSLVLPDYESLVHGWMRPFHFGEQVFMLWLLVMGAKPKPLASPAYCATPSE